MAVSKFTEILGALPQSSSPESNVRLEDILAETANRSSRSSPEGEKVVSEVSGNPPKQESSRRRLRKMKLSVKKG